MKRYILSISLAIIVVVAAFLFFGTYGRAQRLHARLAQADRDLRLLSKQQKEMEAKARILARTRSFVQRAQALGLEKERWDTYEVEIKEPVSFPEAREILSQTGNAGSYYFIPLYIHMTRDPSQMKGVSGPEKTAQGNDASGLKKGDVFMDLKGTFLVRAR
ncbi:MAG: hypothetical protein JRI80_09620 [Deltaproteobacteria bacterium]|nr:hypothetical protein [Deltaproteobacteria bacterium]